MKKAFVMVLSVLMMTLLLAGCGNKNDAATPDSTAADGSVSSRITETAKVLETTSEDGTVEQDKEGNVIEKDKNGEIVSVKDKDGKTIEITEYINAHNYEADGGSGSDKSGEKDSGKQDKGESSDSTEKETISVELEEYELPIV